MTKQAEHGDRFRLLVYGRMWERWAPPCLFIIPASIALWKYAPDISIIDQRLRALTLFPALAAAILLAYTYWARRFSWVECRKGHIWIQTPVLPLVISYSRIRVVRPKPFAQVYDHAMRNSVRRNWMLPYLNATALVVELSSYPMKELWLRLWLSPYLLDPASPELVLLVDNWMTLSRQIDDFNGRWMERRHKQVREGHRSRPSR